MVICKVMLCPYRGQGNFCRNRVLSINQNGLCQHIYNKRNQIKNGWNNPIDDVYKTKVEVRQI